MNPNIPKAPNIIIELTKERLPPDARLIADDVSLVEGGFEGVIAEYLEDIETIEEWGNVISTLQKYLDGIFDFTLAREEVYSDDGSTRLYSDYSIKLTIDGKVKYFQSTSKDLEIYVYDDEVWELLDDFIRNMEYGQEYWLGGVVVYRR